ncbi:hypothetical protein FLA_2713 [Filimonas lacunae]|nr:hypothetical protein FLA_2713 [Filimonas lacunae]
MNTLTIQLLPHCLLCKLAPPLAGNNITIPFLMANPATGPPYVCRINTWHMAIM